MREEIADAARAWIMEFRAATGKFPEFPSDEAGGSAAFFGRGFGGMAGRAESELSRSTVTALSSRDSKGKESDGRWIFKVVLLWSTFRRERRCDTCGT